MKRRTYQIGDARLWDPDGADNVAPAAVISWLEGAAADRAQAAHGKCESTQSQPSPTQVGRVHLTSILRYQRPSQEPLNRDPIHHPHSLGIFRLH